MKKALQSREIEQLPRNFEVLKKEFQKVKNMYFARNTVTEQVKTEAENGRDEYKKTLPIEAFALFWVLLQEFEKFLNANEAEIAEKLFGLIKEKGLKQVVLPKYGIKVVFDEEAQWFFQNEMTKEDWAEYDKKCNSNFKK